MAFPSRPACVACRRSPVPLHHRQQRGKYSLTVRYTTTAEGHLLSMPLIFSVRCIKSIEQTSNGEQCSVSLSITVEIHQHQPKQMMTASKVVRSLISLTCKVVFTPEVKDSSLRCERSSLHIEQEDGRETYHAKVSMPLALMGLGLNCSCPSLSTASGISMGVCSVKGTWRDSTFFAWKF